MQRKKWEDYIQLHYFDSFFFSVESLNSALFPHNSSYNEIGTCEVTEQFCTLEIRGMALISKTIIITLAAFHLIRELFQIFQVTPWSST